MSNLETCLIRSFQLFKPQIRQTVSEALKKAKNSIKERLSKLHPAYIRIPSSKKIPKNKEPFPENIDAKPLVYIDWESRKKSLIDLGRFTRRMKQINASKSAEKFAKSIQRSLEKQNEEQEYKSSEYRNKLIKSRIEMEAKKLKRIQEFKEGQKQYSTVVRAKPNYEKILEKFERDENTEDSKHYFFDKISKRKASRIQEQPLNKIYPQNTDKNSFDRKISYYKSKSWMLIEEERKKKEFESQQLAKQAIELRNKQKCYSEVVKELYKPKVDPKKEQEIHSRRATAERIHKKSPSYVISEIFSEKVFAPKKQIEPHKSPQPRDYLRELKLQRRSLSKIRLPKLDKDLNSISQIRYAESKARACESYLKRSPNKPDAANISEAISNTYINTIRAKIALLDKI